MKGISKLTCHFLNNNNLTVLHWIFDCPLMRDLRTKCKLEYLNLDVDNKYAVILDDPYDASTIGIIYMCSDGLIVIATNE